MCGTHWITTHSLQPSVVCLMCIGYVCTYLSISLVVHRSGALGGYMLGLYCVYQRGILLFVNWWLSMFWLIKGWLVRTESTGITVQDGMCAWWSLSTTRWNPRRIPKYLRVKWPAIRPLNRLLYCRYNPRYNHAMPSVIFPLYLRNNAGYACVLRGFYGGLIGV